ncbi:gamma-glutamyltransferase [Eudoraea chungangensis]|uniref:gamma-glutamyltransferase n=1 Tax=Eudoraea chungangensis TaxID=1481905 RepID=UPI0023EE24A1|nr:gamma-glutamyltransferase [Eudoraea chungangensis]
MKKILLFVLLFGQSHLLISQDRLSGKSFASRSEVLAQNGMAATNHPLATQIAIDILKKGGSAIDAAIAANAFLGLADPAMNGIGGDLFAIVWSAKDQKLFGLNASGKSAQSLSYTQMQKELENGKTYSRGPLSITTPGCVDGWVALHSKFGKLEFSELLSPTINYARAGVPITSEVADFFLMDEPFVKETNNPSFKKLYFTDDHFPRKGDLFMNKDLANTLELIAKEGRKGFYTGRVANGIVNHLKEKGGYLSLEDLKDNQPQWVDPVSVNYRGYDIWELPPNGQGISVLQIINILEGFDIAKMNFGSAAHIHHFTEAKKVAYEDMAKFYGDPKFGNIPLDKLLSKEYSAERRKLINPKKSGSYDPGLAAGDHTIYLTVADKEGNMISLIQSLSAGFGSLEVPEGLGFVLQNRGSGFVMEAGHINQYAPGKRPFHTIIPAFITKDGAPYISFGLMGGDMQPQGHAQIIMNLIDFGMNLQEAGDAPRIFHSGTSARRGRREGVGDTYLESGFDYESISSLMDMGHRIRMMKGIFGGYQAIMIKDKVYYGASESRKDGQAAGY